MIYDRDCRVSDLIEKLNFIKREHGDVEVRLYDKYKCLKCESDIMFFRMPY